jgi:hypothetical protein
MRKVYEGISVSAVQKFMEGKNVLAFCWEYVASRYIQGGIDIYKAD